MSDGDEPDILPCDADPNYECVRVGSAAHAAGPLASPPPGGVSGSGAPPCPEGYVPRRRRNRSYRSEGKVIRTEGPPTRRDDETDDDV